MDDPQHDAYLRRTALQHAMELMDDVLASADDVIAAANIFYNFLKGDTK